MSVTRIVRSVVVGAVSVGSLGACTLNYEVEERTLAKTTPIVLQKPLDLLFVVDNSASMLEEQAALYRSVFDERCPITDTRRVPLDYQNPDRETFDDISEVCGLAQLMAAMGNDFHIGVIATDVGTYDERFSAAQDPDGVHTQLPMRGCLQGKGLITSDDDVAVDFRDAVIGLGVYGSPIERGLDAMDIFLDPESRRAPGCENDLDGFLRPDGQLMVVFVTDEDDCSHRDGSSGFPDELFFEPDAAGDWPELFTESRSGDCYTRANELATIVGYAQHLRQLVTDQRTSEVLVSVVAGLRDDGAGLDAGACIARDDGSIDGVCRAVLGASNTAECEQEGDCCTADGGNRYVDLARSINADSLMGSICAEDFRAPLMPIFSLGELGGDEVF